MNGEVDLYTAELRRLMNRLCSSLDGLSGEALNWRPPVPETNSIYVIASHVLGNARSFVLGIACGRPVERDRPAEFASSGGDPGALITRARELAGEIERALAALPPAALDERREPPQQLWGAGSARPITTREAIMHAIEHAAIHLGQIDITRDLALAGAQASPQR